MVKVCFHSIARICTGSYMPARALEIILRWNSSHPYSRLRGVSVYVLVFSSWESFLPLLPDCESESTQTGALGSHGSAALGPRYVGHAGAEAQSGQCWMKSALPPQGRCANSQDRIAACSGDSPWVAHADPQTSVPEQEPWPAWNSESGSFSHFVMALDERAVKVSAVGH